MVSFIRFNQYNRMVLFSLLITFPLAVLIPSPIYAQFNVCFSDVNFGISMQKLIDKAWKYYNNQDSDSLIDILLDIKNQIESYRGIKINIEKEINNIENQLKQKGHKIPTEIFKKYKNILKKKEKKNYHHALCMESYFINQPNMSFDQYKTFYLDISAKNGYVNKEGIKDPLPFKFVLGVSLMLCGGFVMFATPVCPIFGPAGESLMLTGFGFLVEQGVDIYQKEY